MASMKNAPAPQPAAIIGMDKPNAVCGDPVTIATKQDRQRGIRHIKYQMSLQVSYLYHTPLHV